jgi:predicted kinase
MLVIFRGLPGTGKSYLVSQLVARRPAFHVLSRDVLRHALISHPSYSPEEKDLIDELICSMTGFLLDRERDVVINGMALSSAARVNQLAQVAAGRKVPVRIVECICKEETALLRMAGDEGMHPAADRRAALYFEVKARYQPISHPVLTVDTDQANETSVSAVIAYVESSYSLPRTP